MGVVVSFWLDNLSSNWWLLMLMVLPAALLLTAGLVSNRMVRITVSLAGGACAASLFVLFIIQVYPPAWPVVAISALPSLGCVGGSIILSLFPKPISTSLLADSVPKRNTG